MICDNARGIRIISWRVLNAGQLLIQKKKMEEGIMSLGYRKTLVQALVKSMKDLRFFPYGDWSVHQ